MKFYYVIKEYLSVGFKCLAYIYKFDKRSTVLRLGILVLFPVINNYLNIANARLADGLQQNFGAGDSALAIVLPIFMVIVGFEILNDLFQYLTRLVNWTWRQRLFINVSLERQKKKVQFTIPFIDSQDYDELNQRISQNGAGFNSQMAIVMGISAAIRMVINIGFAFYIVGSYNPLFALLLLVSIMPIFYVSFSDSFAKRRNREKYLDYTRYTEMYGNQFANYTNLKDTKVSGSSAEMLQVFKGRQEFILQKTLAVFRKYLNLGLVASLIAVLVGFFIQFLVIKEVIAGLLLIGQATLIITQTIRVQSQMDEFADFLPDQYENVVSAKFLFLYLETQENVEKSTGKEPVRTTDNIELRDIDFKYPEVRFEQMRKLSDELDSVSERYFGLKKEVIREETKRQNSFQLSIPSLTISKGERVAIVGKNGNGKTTFLQLVLNLYHAEKGDIRLFGNDIRELSQADVQRNFSVLFQDYGQSNFKVHEYIGISGIENPDMDRVRMAAKNATAHEFIEKWTNTYTQQLGIAFKGVKPSKGQWQKLALARAFYKNAPIMVLDEPTSAIDAVSAKEIFGNLAKLDPEKILLFVCHNMADIPLAATRILIFEDGKIVGDGDHATLLKTSPQYKELYESEMSR